jgi:hypothetical protein
LGGRCGTWRSAMGCGSSLTLGLGCLRRTYRLTEARRADGLIATTAAGLAEKMNRAPQRRR